MVRYVVSPEDFGVKNDSETVALTMARRMARECMWTEQQIWEESRATGGSSTNTQKVNMAGEAVASFRRVKFGLLPEPPGNMGSREDVVMSLITAWLWP